MMAKWGDSPGPAAGGNNPRFAGACFPYGVVRRVRFEGLGDGTCRDLSPAPRAHLNVVRGRKGGPAGFSTANSDSTPTRWSPAPPGAGTWVDAGRKVFHASATSHPDTAGRRGGRWQLRKADKNRNKHLQPTLR